MVSDQVDVLFYTNVSQNKEASRQFFITSSFNSKDIIIIIITTMIHMTMI